MKSATERLIELAERLKPTGLIGDGMVAEFHALAARARAEQNLSPAGCTGHCGSGFAFGCARLDCPYVLAA